MLLRHLFALCLAALLLAGGGTASAQTAPPISIGFRPIAPYVLQRPDGSLAGLEYELVMAAGAAGGLSLRAELAPFGRLPEDFRHGNLGAIMPASAAMNLPGCISDTVLVYRNTAFTLQRRGLTITAIADMKGREVLAFQNAFVLLGPEMAALRQDNPQYREIANQMLQVRALFSGRTDVVVLERRIFHYLMRSPDVGVDTSAGLSEHEIFTPNPYGVAFRQEEHCAAFNAGLAVIRHSGVYDEILRRWENTVPHATNGGLRVAAPPFG